MDRDRRGIGILLPGLARQLEAVEHLGEPVFDVQRMEVAIDIQPIRNLVGVEPDGGVWAERDPEAISLVASPSPALFGTGRFDEEAIAASPDIVVPALA